MSGSVRRLIEVDLPIREISAHARREKSIRHGHISTLHIWWARRPLAACRAVVLGALLPDPVDPACPERFRRDAVAALRAFRDRVGGPTVPDEPAGLQRALLDFIARFAAWEASTQPDYLDCARALVRAAHPDGPPLVLDPFAGGGAIPLEALRVGAQAQAFDYNPVAALLLKVVLEEIPRYGEELAAAVRRWGAWVRDRVAADLGRFYPPDPDGAIPIAYLWARVARCEGPGCGAEIPLLRQLWLARKGRRSVALRLVVDRAAKRVDFEIEESPAKVGEGTVRRGSAICPVCHTVTPVARVRAQAKAAGGLPVRMVAVVRTYPGRQGRHYRVATEADLAVARAAEEELRRREKEHAGPLSLVPDEPLPHGYSQAFPITVWGPRTWGDLFLPRQALALSAFVAAVREAHAELARSSEDPAFARAVATCLALATDRSADKWSTLCVWNNVGEKIEHTFGRQALPAVWDFAEGNPFSGATGDWDGALDWVEKVALHAAASHLAPGQAARGDARALPLPDDSVPCIVTDPPYYDAVPYADLSDFFYVWLRRSVGELHPDLFGAPTTPKPGEIVVNPAALTDGRGTKDPTFFESEMRRALAEARRVLAPGGVAVVVFAHKTTSGWEAMLSALLDAGWTVTGSWPVDTERPGRLREQNSAALASSVHIVCRPRPTRAGVGDWREVRAALERRVGEWLPRLAKEGIEGADAIFACLGPAMEVYSRFERVETAAGEPVPLSSPNGRSDVPAFLPAVWAAVAREALRMIFEGAEAEGFEEDARLTALWLWTLRAARDGEAAGSEDEDQVEDDDEAPPRRQSLRGFGLDYDTARKLAQALGAHLEDLGRPGGIVAVRGNVAALLAVEDRRRTLLGGEAARPRRQDGLFDDPAVTGSAPEPEGIPTVRTTLDRVHQAMLLFADGRSGALQRVLAEGGTDPRFRRLVQALSALYPSASPEKRWVDGVIAVLRQSGG
jgi:adenine-specific DNA methylase